MLFAILLFAQLLGAGSTTNVTIVSDVKTEKAWERKVVMKDGQGEIFNDDNMVGSTAEVATDREAALHAGEIAEAARVSMTNEINRMYVAAEDAATNSIALAFVFMPETSRTNLTGFVVYEETDGTTDTQYVWFNKELAMQLNRYVVYQGIANCSTQKVTWVNWATTTNITVNGRTWNGCHKCTVQRPAWAVGEPCLTNPNESKWGGRNGFDFGDMTLTMGGVPLDTCILTNKTDATDVIYFDNGFYKGHL